MRLAYCNPIGNGCLALEGSFAFYKFYNVTSSRRDPSLGTCSRKRLAHGEEGRINIIHNNILGFVCCDTDTPEVLPWGTCHLALRESICFAACTFLQKTSPCRRPPTLGNMFHKETCSGKIAKKFNLGTSPAGNKLSHSLRVHLALGTQVPNWNSPMGQRIGTSNLNQ